MSGSSTAEQDAEIQLEERAHRLRLAMLGDAEFLAGIERGADDERGGRMVSFADFKRELGLG